MKKTSWALMTAGTLMLSGLGAYNYANIGHASAASNAIYGNNATSGVPYAFAMTPGTFAITDTFSNLSSNNGRGVVVVGDTMYYTAASSASVYTYTLSTHTNNGAKFTVAGASALSTIAYDGTNFWVGDYSGSNQAYLYSPAGVQLKVVHLTNCGGSCDGLGYFNQGGTTPRLISNRGDAVGPYDTYDTDGAIKTTSFITTTGFSPTGIPYDGTNFLVSDIYGAKIVTYNGTTGALISSKAITGAQGSFTPLIEDLSADYTVTLTPQQPSSVPTLSEFGLFLCALLLLGSGVYMNRRRAV